MTTDTKTTPRFVAGTDGDGDQAVLDTATGKVYGFILADAAHVAETWNSNGDFTDENGAPVADFEPNDSPDFTPAEGA